MREDRAFALDRAIDAGDADTARALLADEPRLTGTAIPVERDWGEEVWLALHRAADTGQAELVALLLEAGASVDARTRFRTPMHARRTPLMLASAAGHEAVVRLLLERGADASLLDADHRSALSLAARAGHLAVVRRLIEAGAPLDPVDDQQRTPLHAAIAAGHPEAAMALIDAGADVDHRCPKEPSAATPLARCAAKGEAMDAVAQRLTEAGADAAQQ